MIWVKFPLPEKHDVFANKPKLMPYARASFPSHILGWMLAYRFKERPEVGVGWEVCSTQCGNIKLLARVFEWIFIVLWYSARSIFAAIKMLPFFTYHPLFFFSCLSGKTCKCVCLNTYKSFNWIFFLSIFIPMRNMKATTNYIHLKCKCY